MRGEPQVQSATVDKTERSENKPFFLKIKTIVSSVQIAIVQTQNSQVTV